MGISVKGSLKYVARSEWVQKLVWRGWQSDRVGLLWNCSLSGCPRYSFLRFGFQNGKSSLCSCHLNSEVGCHFNSLLGCSIKLYWKAAQGLWAEAHLQAKREMLWFYCWFSSYLQVSRSLEAISSSCLLFLDKVFSCLQQAKECSTSFINGHASNEASCIKMLFDNVNTVRPAKRFGIPYKFSLWYVPDNQTYLRVFLRFYFFVHHLSLPVIKIVLGFNDMSQSLTCLQYHPWM